MNTIKLRNGGKIVRVTENELEKYLTKGYVRVENKKVTEKQETVSQKPVLDTYSGIPAKPRTNKRKGNKQ